MKLVKIKKRDRALWQYLCERIHEHARDFNLALLKVRPLKRKWLGKYLGSCSKRGVIRIAVRDDRGNRLDAYSLIDTMAHEIAHLKHQKHTDKWFELYFQVLDLMRVGGAYRDLREILGKTNI